MCIGDRRWDDHAVAALAAVSEAWELPVATAFRRQELIDNRHPNYAGDVGIGPNPALKARIDAADLVI